MCATRVAWTSQRPRRDDAIADAGPDAIDAAGMSGGVLAAAHLARLQLVRPHQPAIDDSQPLPLTDDAMERPTFSAMEHPMAYTKILDGAAYLFTFIWNLFFPKTKINSTSVRLARHYQHKSMRAGKKPQRLRNE